MSFFLCSGILKLITEANLIVLYWPYLWPILYKDFTKDHGDRHAPCAINRNHKQTCNWKYSYLIEYVCTVSHCHVVGDTLHYPTPKILSQHIYKYIYKYIYHISELLGKMATTPRHTINGKSCKRTSYTVTTLSYSYLFVWKYFFRKRWVSFSDCPDFLINTITLLLRKLLLTQYYNVVWRSLSLIHDLYNMFFNYYCVFWSILYHKYA